MTCEIISDILTFGDLLVWPTTCDYYFWLKLLGAIMFIIGWVLYKAEEKRENRGDLIGSLAVSSIAIVVLASIGTLIKNTAGIAMIQSEVLLILLAICIPLVLIWNFKGD